MGPVTCILLVAGHASRLAFDVQKDVSGCLSSLQGIPKALLPGPNRKTILDLWWQALNQCEDVSQVILVTNADKYKHFERWASASGFPLTNIVNDGSTLPSKALGAVGDLELVVRTRQLLDSDVLVIAGDMMFQAGKLKIKDVVDFWREHPDGDVAVCYSLQSSELTTSRGILEVDDLSKRVTKFLEKPLPTATSSRFGSVVFYGFRGATLQQLQPYLKSNVSQHYRTMGSFIGYIVNELKLPMYGYLVSSDFQLIGDVSLQDYLSWLRLYTNNAPLTTFTPNRGFKARAFARVGIVGNPSDGFYGKTIAMTIGNFWSDVTIEESPTLRLLPHPLNDPTEFGSLNDLHGISTREGYLGGLRLLQATCKMFLHYCTQHNIVLSGRNFTLSYDTNIPRQVGLAGSSAIVTAALHALMAFYEISDDQLPKTLRPQLVLDVEKQELSINAGLQDRVVQVYQGLVYMDFSHEILKRQGHGHYKHITLPEGTKLPSFFLAYRPDPSDSGKIHSDVRERFDKGDALVQEGMSQLASITDMALAAIMRADWHSLGGLMRQNFGIRKRLYGREALGEQNLRMVEVGEAAGASVKFPGSGGAVLGLVSPNTDMDSLRCQYQSEGCVVVDVIPQLDSSRTLLPL
ncbi:probable glucuronokinase 2 [Hyalella azteca]|uniref:Probable glucuronokinase 2 n=1 Tax=Hyalella azteca TaxID=294128 RepID=A0A8B7NB15_HYAAZ|nr:probable glucuronokinase 2 [Hyalella azteca]